MAAIRVAMVGLDTSHCEGFINEINYPDSPHHVPGARVVKAFPGGSNACAVSRDRIQGFTKTIREKHGIAICDSLDACGKDVDAIILTSVDGRQHLDQFKVLAKFGKPVFIDKPLACSTADSRAILDISKKTGAPIMSSSSVRYLTGLIPTAQEMASLRACEAFGPMSILDDYPTFYWYGIHSVDLLYRHLGRGCESVRVVHENTMDVMVGRWADGRIGTVRGIRQDGAKPFGCIRFSDSAVTLHLPEPDATGRQLGEAIVAFFQTGRSAIDVEETFEIMAFLEAAERSLRASGGAVPLAR